MASIQRRERSDGSIVYRAQIVIKRDGEIIHREGNTFSDRKDAALWAAKREKSLSKSGGLEQAIAKKSDVTLGDLIRLYERRLKPVKSWGRTKQAVLNALKDGKYANQSVADVNSAWVIEYCLDRRAESGAHKATINQDYTFMRSVFSMAKDVLGVPVTTQPFDEARATLKRLDLVGKSDERDRRPEHEEITAIMELAHKSAKAKRRFNSPIDKIILFQMFSARRISETTRLLWSDLDSKNKKILVRDMKDPTKKEGNHVLTLLTDEALSIIESMPKVDERVFPFDPKSIESRFARLRDKAGYYTGTTDDLRLHDLRHECLSWLAEKNGLNGENWDIPRLQMVSGHKNWNVLQRYVNLLTDKPHDRWEAWKWKP